MTKRVRKRLTIYVARRYLGGSEEAKDTPKRDSAKPKRPAGLPKRESVIQCVEGEGEEQRARTRDVRALRFIRIVPSTHSCPSVVILKAEVSDEVFAAQVAQRVFQFHQLDKNIVLRIEAGRSLRRLEIEGEPLLYSLHPDTLG